MPRSWTLLDFVLVILGGFLGVGVLAVGLVFLEGEPLLIMGLVGQYVGQLLVFWLLSRNRTDPDVGFHVERNDIGFIGLGMVLQVGLAIVFLPLSYLLFPDGGSAQQVSAVLSELESVVARVSAVAIAAVLAPVVEELAFRGVLLRALASRSHRTALIVSAALFAAFHLLGLEPANLIRGAAIVLPQIFIVGLVLGRLVQRRGRLGPAIFTHSGYNLLAALLLLVPPELLEGLA